MAIRPFPSFWMDKNNRNEWWWKYQASNHLTIAVSSESYKNRKDCERSIEIMKACFNSELWLPSALVKAS